MSQCCGLSALSRITELKETSMFTLLHLAKDNGLKLYFCKVEPDELVKVVRPAIFHQKDHFVFIENGEAMPEGEYTGYVLTKRPLHEPLPFTLAKKIMGRKKGGGFLAPIVTAVASFVNPILGAVVGAGVGAHRASGGSGFDGDAKGEFFRIGTGALTGATAQSNPAISAISAAAGELPGAIKSGEYLRPVSAGLGQYAANVGSGGVAQGVKGATGGSLNKVSEGIRGGFKALAGGVEAAPNATTIPTPSGYGGSVTLPGVGSTSLQTAKGFLEGTIFGMPTDKGDIFNLGNGAKLLGAGLSMAIPKPKYEGLQPTESFSKAAQFLGNEDFQKLPSATREQLASYSTKPLQELAKEFYAPDDKGLRQLEERKQQAVDALTVQYASYGQDPYTSTQARKELNDITRQYDQAIGEYQQQVQNQALDKAIKFKQDMLGKAMEQGNFDYEAASELASYMGLDQQYRYALETKNYDQLQNLLAEIFSFGR